MSLKILEEDEELNPILSVVNLIDVFLVLIAALLIIIVENPLNPFSQDDVTIVKTPGQANMEMIIKKGEKIERYKASDAIGQGEGSKAGVAYRMKDGSFVYVPEG
ncbi:MAG: DUF2149 domain-containing protein [Gammaproteobacteria bacterium]|nr:DUF2149 domain-containing protein [Gammaproteobacteria bacterium]